MSAMSKFLVLSTTLFAFSNGQTFSYDRQTQQDILDWHNTERAQTANGNEYCSSGNGVWDTTCPAGAIRRISWDSTLASVAQDWAESLANDDCAWGHSTNEWRESRLLARQPAFGYPMSGMYDYIGENIARSGSSGSYPTGEDTWNNWVDRESGIFKYGSRSVQSSGGYGQNPDTKETGNGQIGHYTQVVADRSQFLGCGFAGNRCYDADSGWWFYYSYTVCMYYPGGNFGSTYEYPYTEYSSNSVACNNCPDGYSCNSAGLCDNGQEDNFDTPIPTANTPSPTLKPTPQPTTPQPTATVVDETPSDNDDDGSSTSSADAVIITGFDNFSGLNGKVFNAFSVKDGDYSRTSSDNPVYGPVELWGYTFYIYYDTASWYQNWVLTYSGIGSGSRTAYCNDKGQTSITSCTSWNDWGGRSNIMVVSAAQAYSSSSSSNNSDKDKLIEGLLIGLGIAIGVFAISLLIYWCVKRKNSQKNQYNIVEMNNEISNHEYVTMGN